VVSKWHQQYYKDELAQIYYLKAVSYLTDFFMGFKQTIINTINKLPYVRGLHEAHTNFQKNALYPAGHFYSPIISVEAVRQREAVIWESREKDGIEGIDLRTDEQLALMRELSIHGRNHSLFFATASEA
jgi:hypothetical protein